MRIAIIGAGFSGCQLAIELLRGGPSPAEILLIEQSATFGPGVAFAARHDRLLLNTRVANMSALATDPSHFLRWLWARDLPEHSAASIPPSGHAFVARGVYGQYLASFWRTQKRRRPTTSPCAGSAAASWALPSEHGVLWLKLDDDSTCVADVAVLCIGNLPPRLPPAPGVETCSGPRLISQSLGRGEHRAHPAVRSGPAAGQRPDHGRCRGPARRPRPSRSDPGALAARSAADGARPGPQRATFAMARCAADRARVAPADPPRDRACGARGHRLAGRARRLASPRTLALAPAADRRASALPAPPAALVGHPPPSDGARDRDPDQSRCRRAVSSRSGPARSKPTTPLTKASRSASGPGAPMWRPVSSATGS